jgi:hypothetical protein
MPLLNGIGRIAPYYRHTKGGRSSFADSVAVRDRCALVYDVQDTAGRDCPTHVACFVAHGVMKQERIGSFIGLKSKKRMGCQLIDRGRRGRIMSLGSVQIHAHPKVKGRQHGHSGLQRHAQDCIELLGIGTIYRSTPEKLRSIEALAGGPVCGFTAPRSTVSGLTEYFHMFGFA